jgi:hypothetical protein
VTPAARRYALIALALTLPVATGVLSFVAASSGAAAAAWTALGWSITAVAGVVGGAWVVSRHGRAGAGFFVALQACILARLGLSAIGAILVASRDPGAAWAYLAGLVAGFLPLQAFEILWFFRNARRA